MSRRAESSRWESGRHIRHRISGRPWVRVRTAVAADALMGGHHARGHHGILRCQPDLNSKPQQHQKRRLRRPLLPVEKAATRESYTLDATSSGLTTALSNP